MGLLGLAALGRGKARYSRRLRASVVG